MTAPSLPSALRAAADGLCPFEAATGLIIAQASWLDRDDFARFIHREGGTAAIDWEAAIIALDAGELPSSAGERRMLELAVACHRPVISATRFQDSTTATSGYSSPFSTPPAIGSPVTPLSRQETRPHRVLPSSLFEHPEAELSVDDSAQLGEDHVPLIA